MQPTKATVRKPSRGKPAPEPEPSNKRRLVIGVTALALMVGVIWYARSGSKITKVMQMRQELLAQRDELSPEERQEKLGEIRAEREKLSPEERDQLRGEVTLQMQKKRNDEAARYLAMSPEEREKWIDERLARAQSAPLFAPPGAGGGVDGGGGKGGGGGFGGGPQNPDNPRASATPEDRDSKRREALLHMTPAARAGLDQMRQDMATRRAQLGLPLTPQRGKGGP